MTAGIRDLPEQALSAGAVWRQNWQVVLAAAAGLAATTVISYSNSLFIQPMTQEFGWSRAQVMSGAAVASITAVVCAPVTGFVVDRFGPRRLGLAAISLLCIGVAVLGLAGPSPWGWRAMWIPIAVAIVIGQPSVWTAAVTSLYLKGRGFALAVTLCGSGIASIIYPPVTYFLIAHYGWRLAWAGLGGFVALYALPLLWFCFSSARDRERLAPRRLATINLLPRRSVWQSGILTLRYAQLLLAATCIAGVIVTLGVSLVPVLSSNGLTRGQAAGIASLLGFSSIFGRLVIGMLLDRMNGRFIAAFAVCLPIAGILLLLGYPGSLPAASAAVLILGLSMGAELDIVAFLTSRYFNTANFGLLFGTIGGFIGLAGGNGPMLLNAVFDAMHSYRPALWGAIPICLLSATLFLLLGPYPDLATPKPSPEPEHTT